MASAEESAFTKLFYHGWSVDCAELRDFADHAQASPAVLELFSQILQKLPASCNTVQGGAAPTSEVVNPFLLVQPAKHRERLQRLIRKAKTLLAPVRRGDADDWVMCAITLASSSTQCETECVVSHSTELSSNEQRQLETMLESTFSIRRTTYRRYKLENRRSHVVVLFEIMAVRLQPTPQKRT